MSVFEVEKREDYNLSEMATKVVELENKLAEAKNIKLALEDVKAKMKEAMERNDIKTWETPNGIKVTLVADKESEENKEIHFDEVNFRLENKELYDKYCKEVTVITPGRKGYVRVTIPKSMAIE